MAGRVIVVGSANVDLVWHGPRLPRPGETVSDGSYLRVLGGKGANQAAAVARLGGAVAFVGCVGTDEHGALVRADLAERGVDCTHLAAVDDATGVALITVDQAGENTVAVAPGANRALTPDVASAAVHAMARAGDIVLCSFEIPVEAALATVVAARERSARTVVNPAPARDEARAAIAEFAAITDVLTPNETEADAYGGASDLSGYGATVIVTLGAAGAALHRAATTTGSRGPLVTMPSIPVDVVDTTGAGDAFNGALAWALAGGAALDAAVEIAVAAGALATRAVGARAALATAAEIDAAIARAR